MSKKNTAHSWGKIAKFPVVVASIGLVAGMGLPVTPAIAAEEVAPDSAAVTLDDTAAVADDTATVKSEAAETSFKVTMGTAKAGKALPVTVTLKNGKSGVPVVLERDRVGADQVVSTKSTGAKGVVNFTIPGKMVTRTPQAFTVDADGATSASFVVQAVRDNLGAVPGAVSGFKATPFAGRVDLSWSARSGATSYLVQYQPQGAGDEWESVTTTALTYSVKGLTDGNAYGFRVAAANAEGTGVFTSTIVETPKANPPAAVTNLTATPIDSSVTLKWTAASRATSYQVERTCKENVNFDSAVCFINKQTVTSTTATWGGLDNGTTYLFAVSGVGADGVGPRATIEATPQAKPAQPANFNVQAGNEMAFLTWSAVPGAEDYRSYQKSATGTAVYGDWTKNLSTQVRNLKNGEPYTIGVQARNAFGSSTVLSDTGITPTSNAPGAIGSVAAVPADNSVLLTWTPAAQATDYVVNYKPVDNSAAPQTLPLDKAVTSDSNYFSMVIPGLVNGTVYEFAVYGENDYGRGDADTVRAAAGIANTATGGDTAVAAIPTTPGSLAVQTRDKGLALTWGSSGNAPTQYLVYYSPNAQDWTLFETNPSSDRNSLITPLTNGQRYWVQVVAANADGASAPAVAGPFTPAPTPAAPTNVRAFASNDALQVQWAPVAFATRYLVRWKLSTSSTYSPVLYVEGNSYRITGLQNNTDYDISVAANNTTGTSAANIIGPISPTNLTPDVVTDVTGKPGNEEVTLTWTAPADANGYKVVTSLANTNKTVEEVKLPGLRTVKDTGAITIEHTVRNLSNGVDYNFTIYSTNQYGWSGPTVAGPFKPEGQIIAPEAPTITSVVPGDTMATINYRINNPGSSPIAKAQYSMANGAAGTWYDTDLTSPHLETDLTNGQTYQVVMRVVDLDGTVSPVSNMVTVTPIGVPAKPSIDSIDAGDGQLTVNFTAPTSAAAPVSNIYYSINGGTSFIEETDKTSPIVIKNLTNGTEYSVVVRSANRVGGRNSDVVEATPTAPITPPMKPGILTVAPTAEGELTVTFGAPESTTQPVNKVEYRTQPAGGTWTDWTALASETAPFKVTGALGVSLDVQIRSVNNAGATASDIASGTPIGLPLKPSITNIEPGDKELTVNFDTPATAANPLDKVFYSINGGSTFVEHTSRTSPLIITGLTNGTTYSVVVHSANELGNRNSDPVDGTPIPPIVAPAQPSITNVEPTAAGVLTVTFDAPATAGAPVDKVEYRTQPADGTWSNWTALPSATAPFTVTGELGVSLDVQIRSVNTIGATESGIANGTPIGAPNAPVITSVEDGDAQFTVNFAINSTPGKPVNSVQYRIDNGSWVTVTPADATSFTVTSGVRNGDTYSVVVRAVNTLGATNSDPAEAAPFTKPSAPTVLNAERDDASATVNYRLNANGGRDVTKLRFTYSWTDATGAAKTDSVETSNTTSPMSITGLTNGITYTITMAAQNAAGWSPESNGVTVTPISIPVQPTIDAVKVGDKQLEVTFTAPASDAAPVDDVYYRLDGGTWVKIAGKTSPVVISGLTNGKPYTVEIMSRNAMGDAISVPANGTPKPNDTAPDAPTMTGATPGNNKAFITYTLNGDGGSPITSVEYRAVPADGSATVTGTINAQSGVFPSPYTIAGLTNDKTYSVAIRAVNIVGPSTWSNALEVTPPGGEWRDATFVPERYSCSNGGTLDGNQCVTQEQVPGYYTCPAGWNLNGTQCQRSVWVPESGYWSCPNGGAWNGSQCVQSQAPSQTPTCPSGGYFDGSQCVITANGDPVYSCDNVGNPSGRYRVGSTCYWDVWVCPSGWEKVSDSLCKRATPVGGYGPKGVLCSTLKDQYMGPNDYGWSCTNNPNGAQWSYMKVEYDYNAQKTPRSGPADIVDYTCPAGYQKSGSTCTLRYPPTYQPTCPAGWTIESGTCYNRYPGTWVVIPGYWTTETQNATWVPPTTREVRTPADYTPARYVCDAGGILDGTRCFYPNVDAVRFTATSGAAPASTEAAGLPVPVVKWDRSATTANAVTFTWDLVPGADNYLCNGVTVGITNRCIVKAKPDTIVAASVVACNDNTCSTPGTARAATNPDATDGLRVSKVTQAVAGGDRCATLAWRDVTADDRYHVIVERDGTFAAQQTTTTPGAQVCGLAANGEYIFVVWASNRLDKTGTPVSDGGLVGTPSGNSLTIDPVPTKASAPKVTANKANPGNIAASVTATVAGGLPKGATHTVFQVVGQPTKVKTAGTTARIGGLPFNTNVQITASFCNADGCSAPSKASKTVKTAAKPAGR